MVLITGLNLSVKSRLKVEENINSVDIPEVKVRGQGLSQVIRC